MLGAVGREFETVLKSTASSLPSTSDSYFHDGDRFKSVTRCKKTPSSSSREVLFSVGTNLFDRINVVLNSEQKFKVKSPIAKPLKTDLNTNIHLLMKGH